MSITYPVNVEVESPVRYDRTLVFLRIAFAIGLGWLGIDAGGFACAAFILLPVAAAIIISTRGARRYLDEDRRTIWRAGTWLLDLSAFMMFLTDTFPTAPTGVQFELRTTGTPTVGSALSRLLTSIPSVVVLSLLTFVGGFVTLFAAIGVLVTGRVPASLLAYQRGVLRWQTRLLAYHASLVDEYPPFSFDTEDRHDHPAFTAAGAP